MRPSTLSSRRTLAVLALSLSLVAFPLGVLASHQYSDVPNSNPFHGDITAITNAGVTSGCGGGQYCPDRNVTRAEMAAFMNRLGALASNKTPVVNATKVDGFDGTDLALGLATIPSGVTVTGAGVFDSAIIADNADHAFYVELPARAPVALVNANINFAPDGAAIDDDATCTGTWSAPTAPAGKVCIYLAGTGGIDNAGGYATNWIPVRYFAILFRANGTAGADMYMFYSWAYTAP